MMKVNLIRKTDAITVLNTMLPEEDWEHLIDSYLDISHAEGMEFLIQEDVIEFVVDNYESHLEQIHTRILCIGVIHGIDAEARRRGRIEWLEVLESLDISPETATSTTAESSNDEVHSA